MPGPVRVAVTTLSPFIEDCRREMDLYWQVVQKQRSRNGKRKKKMQRTPNTARLTDGAWYLIWKLIEGVRAAMQATSMVRTSPTSRIFCTTYEANGVGSVSFWR